MIRQCFITLYRARKNGLQNIFKKDPGRDKQKSQGTAGWYFTKPRTSHFFSHCNLNWHVDLLISNIVNWVVHLDLTYAIHDRIWPNYKFMIQSKYEYLTKFMQQHWISSLFSEDVSEAGIFLRCCGPPPPPPIPGAPLTILIPVPASGLLLLLAALLVLRFTLKE